MKNLNVKNKPWRNPKYVKWVKEQPCIITNQYGVDCHHLIGHGFSGMGTKAPDWAVIPLTREVHTELHTIGFKEWENRNGSQLFLLMRFWQQNFDIIQGFIGNEM